MAKTRKHRQSVEQAHPSHRCRRVTTSTQAPSEAAHLPPADTGGTSSTAVVHRWCNTEPNAAPPRQAHNSNVMPAPSQPSVWSGRSKGAMRPADAGTSPLEAAGPWTDGRDDKVARRDMIALIARRGVTDCNVLRVMGRLPRQCFVPAAMRSHAYEDRPLPIGDGQTISQPYMVAFMSVAANLRRGDKVLEIGTGCGYQAAVLAALGAQVFSVEIIPSLAEQACARLMALGLNVSVRTGDGALGWRDEAPFAAILVTAAPPTVPRELLAQLADGGRMVIPVGASAATQALQIWHRDGIQWRVETTFAVRFVPMTGRMMQTGAI